MSLTLSDLQVHFRRIGKAINISHKADSGSHSLKDAAATLMVQDIANNEESFNTLKQSWNQVFQGAVTAASGVDAVSGKGSTTGGQIQAGIESYLRNIVGPDLGLSPTASVAAVNTALIASMTNAEATVNSSGSDPYGFGQYFQDIWDVALPAADSPNIPDSYINSCIITP